MTARPTDTSLDFFSEEFDPIKALASVSLQPPVNIKPFDYLEKCRILLDPSDPNYLPINAKLLEKQKQQAKKAEVAPVPAPTSTDSAAVADTNEAPISATNTNNSADNVSQGQSIASTPCNTNVASAGTSSGAPKRKNVLQNMMDEVQQGPVALLHECCAQRARVRVVIRRVKDVRGHCTGQLLAYDKYFNLLLRNVTEEYTRSSKPRDASEGESKHSEVQTRRVKQLLIKGDSVVLISRVTTE